MKARITAKTVKDDVNKLRTLFMSGKITKEEYRQQLTELYKHKIWLENAIGGDILCTP